MKTIENLEEEILKEDGPFAEYNLDKNKETFFFSLNDVIKDYKIPKDKLAFFYNDRESDISHTNLYIVKPKANNKIIKHNISRSSIHTDYGYKSKNLIILEKIAEKHLPPGYDIDKIIKSNGKGINSLRIYGILRVNKKLECPVIKVSKFEDKILKKLYRQVHTR